MELDHLNPTQVITQFILETRRAGVSLSSDEYQVIEKWLSDAGSLDVLVPILMDMLPKHFEKRTVSGHKKSLASIQKKISKKIVHYKNLTELQL